MAALFAELSTRWLDDLSKKQIQRWVERMDLIMEIIEEAVEEAVEKATVKALAQGKQEGRMEARIDLARKLLSAGEPIKRVADLTGLSIDEVKSLSSQQ